MSVADILVSIAASSGSSALATLRLARILRLTRLLKMARLLKLSRLSKKLAERARDDWSSVRTLCRGAGGGSAVGLQGGLADGDADAR